MKQYWIVGNALPEQGPNAWEFGGLFESEPKAIAACDSNTDFIAPVYLNEIPPGKALVWSGAYYPKLIPNDHQTP